jgi:hypothetical protein
MIVRYAQEKHRLMKLNKNERPKYVEGKGPIIWDILHKASLWSQDIGLETKCNRYVRIFKEGDGGGQLYVHASGHLLSVGRVFMKKYIIILLLINLITGCDSRLKESKNEIPITDNNLPTESLKSTVESENSIGRQLIDNDFVLNLVTEAFNRTWRVEVADYNEAEGSTFKDGSTTYRFYSSDIDTEEEMNNYLEEVYTEKITKEITKEIFKHQKNGKLYHSDGELGTLMGWGDSKFNIIPEESNGYKQFFDFQVPTTDDFFDEEKVELILIKDRGWRVNSYIDY